MSLGESNFQVRSGAGQQRASAASLARAIVGFGCTPLGKPNTLIPVGDPSAIPGLLDSGELAEWAAFTARAGQTRYCVPITPSAIGYVGATTQNGSGAGTIAGAPAPHKPIQVLCITGGALGTMTVRISLDGGLTYGPVVASVAGSTWVYLVPGTYCTLTFAAATYVATKICTIDTKGTVTNGSAWVGVVTQASSPIDSYELLCTVVKGGALGVVVLSISLDNGRTALPNVLIPAGGVIAIPGTGIAITCANTFVTGEMYSFLAAPPGYSGSDLTAALTALKALKSAQFTQIHVIGMPGSAASAFTAAALLEASIEDALANKFLDWDGMVECPSSGGGLALGDVIVLSSAVVRDTADTDSVIIAARGADTNRVAMHAGSYPMISALGTSQRVPLRPLGWAVAARYVDTDPRQDIAALQPFGALQIFIPPGATTIGRDESATPGLDDVQINTARQYQGRNGVYLSITSGGAGWKNMTTDAGFQDKGLMRIVNSAVARLRPIAQDLLGQRPAINPDGTIAEEPARGYDLKLDGSIKLFTGVRKGGDFASPQASVATANVLRSSQLGTSPKRLDIAYSIQGLGFVSSEANALVFGGVLSVIGQ